MRIAVVALACATVLVSSAAFSFQEQSAGAPSAQPGSTAPAAAPQAPELGLEGAAPSAPAPAGTEVRIPGLGKLGVLPKMDFGLELLYGAAEPKQTEPSRDPAAQPEDLTIRGTVKHNF